LPLRHAAHAAAIISFSPRHYCHCAISLRHAAAMQRAMLPMLPLAPERLRCRRRFTIDALLTFAITPPFRH
jgi:hypothetical protein